MHIGKVNKRHTRVVTRHQRIRGLLALLANRKKRCAARRIDNQQITVRQCLRQIAVEDVKIERLTWYIPVEVALESLDGWQAAQHLIQKQITFAHHEDAPCARTAGYCPR